MRLFNREFKHPYLDVFACLLVIVLLGGSVLGYLSYKTAQDAKTRLAKEHEQEQETVRTFVTLMTKHDEFIVLVFDIDSTLMQAKAKIESNLAAQEAWDDEWASRQADYQQEVDAVKAHNKAEDDKYHSDPRYTQRNYWPAPAFPGPPAPISVDFSAEIAALNGQSAELKLFLTGFKKISGDFKAEEIRPMYRNLLVSAEELRSALDRDIDILNKIVSDDDQGQVVSSTKADLMKYNTEDVALKGFHEKALAFVKNHQLDVKDYELPTGADAKPQDKSNLR